MRKTPCFIVLVFLSLFFFCCRQRFPVRKVKNSLAYRSCKMYGYSKACFRLAKLNAYKALERKGSDIKQKALYSRISFYLKRACELRDPGSCAVFAIWSAHLKIQCSVIKNALRRSCQYGSWEGCTLAAFLAEGQMIPVQDKAFYVLKASHCFPKEGIKKTTEKLHKAFCLAAKYAKKDPQSLDVDCKKNKVYTRRDRLSLCTAISYWSGSHKSIFKLIERRIYP